MKRLKISEVIQGLEVQKLTIFSPAEFGRFFKVDPTQARIFLSRNTKQGYFIRLKNGLYSPKKFQPSPFEIANVIYRPSYLSLEIALSYYRIIPEVVYTTTSITTRTTKEFKILNQIYRYHKINKGLYFGYRTVRIGDRYIVIATKEKALLDYLYFVAMGQKKYNDRFDFKEIDRRNFVSYSGRFFKNIHNRYIKKNFGLLLNRVKPKNA